MTVEEIFAIMQRMYLKPDMPEPVAWVIDPGTYHTLRVFSAECSGPIGYSVRTEFSSIYGLPFTVAGDVIQSWEDLKRCKMKIKLERKPV